MKKILIALVMMPFAAIAWLSLVLFMLMNGRKIRKAYGMALYSSAGAWARIQEYAQTQGKANYIEEADEKVVTLEHDLGEWRQSAETAGLDIAIFEKARADAYETTDRNIKNGQNPLAHLDDLEYWRTRPREK